MCHFTIDGWKREDKKAKPLGFGTGSETLVSLSLSLSHKWLTNRPRNITPLPFAFFPAHWTFLYSLQSRITTEEGWCVFPFTTEQHQWCSCWGWPLSSGLSTEALDKWEEKGYPFHQGSWDPSLLSIPQRWLISKSSGGKQGGRCVATQYHRGSRALTSFGAPSDKFNDKPETL